MKSGASGYSVLAAPGDGRTPPRHSPAVTDPLHGRAQIRFCVVVALSAPDWPSIRECSMPGQPRWAGCGYRT